MFCCVLANRRGHGHARYATRTKLIDNQRLPFWVLLSYSPKCVEY
jgi:hypothetical protein